MNWTGCPTPRPKSRSLRSSTATRAGCPPCSASCWASKPRTQTTAGTLFGQGTISPFLASGMQSAAASGESTLVPVRFGVDQRTNSIIATGSEGDLGVVEAILMRLDEQSLRQHKTMVYWLANVPATERRRRLEPMDHTAAPRCSQQQLQISPESPDIQWNRRVIVVPETISNTIIISAAPELFDEVKHVVESLDRRPPLIKIDVLIAEVAADNNFEFGTEFGSAGLAAVRSHLFQRQARPAQTVPGFNFNNKPLGDTGDRPKHGERPGPGTNELRAGARQSTWATVAWCFRPAVTRSRCCCEPWKRRGVPRSLAVPPSRRSTASPPPSTSERSPPGRAISQTANSTTQDVKDVGTGCSSGVTPQVTPDGLIMMEIDAERSRLG